MGQPKVGTVVTIRFPYSDLRGSKIRPALVIAEAEFGDLILCQITSKPYSSRIAIKLEKKNFVSGNLPLKSFARPDKLFTADNSIISSVAGQLDTSSLNCIRKATQALFTSSK